MTTVFDVLDTSSLLPYSVHVWSKDSTQSLETAALYGREIATVYDCYGKPISRRSVSISFTSKDIYDGRGSIGLVEVSATSTTGDTMHIRGKLVRLYTIKDQE